MTAVVDGAGDPAEVAAAKNVVYDVLETTCAETVSDPLAVADVIVDALLAAGVTIPTTIEDPHTIFGVRHAF